MFASLSQRIGFVFLNQFLQFKALSHYSQPYKMRFKLLTGSKPIYKELKYTEKVLKEFQRLSRFPRKMVLYSSTNFCILKPWAIISRVIRLDLGLWQASKAFYRKLKYRQKVLEEFQRVVRFPRKMVVYSSTNFGILKPSAIISNLIRFDLGFWETSKQFYRKLKYREKVFEEFRRLLRFPRKMVLDSSTPFGIWRPEAIISNLIRFDLGCSQDSKPFDRKLKYRENIFEECQHLRRFSRKIVLYSRTKFRILNPWATIFNVTRFDLFFPQASKPFYRNLKYREKIFEEFQHLCCFTRKMVLYSSTIFGILNTWAIICNLIRFDLGYSEVSKPFYRKLKYKEKVLGEFHCLPRFPRIMVLYSSTNFRIL